MNPQNRTHPILNLWNRLIEPVASLQDTEQRRNARLLAGLLLATGLLLAVVLPLRHVAYPESPYALQRLSGALLGVVAVLFGYFLTRRGQHLLAGKLMVCLGTIIIFVLVMSVPPSIGIPMLYYGIVLTIFASLFLPLRFAFFTACAQIVVMLLLPIAAPVYNYQVVIEGPVLFSVILTFVTLLFAGYRAYLETYRRAQLAESENRYRMVSEGITDYAFSYRVEPNGEMVREWITDSFARVTGFNANDFSPRGRMRFFHPDDDARVAADIQTTLQGETTAGEYRFITKDGFTRWLMIYRNPIWDAAQNRVVRYFGASQDITERKQAEAEALKMAIQQERLNVLGSFMEAVSHDFRTSLATIETSRYLLQQTLQPTPTEKTEKRLASIQRAVFHLTEQIENLNTVSSLLSPNICACDLNPLLENLVRGLLSRAKQKRITLTLTPDPHLPPILFDADQLQRAITHLVTNAITYTPEGGAVWLRTCNEGSMAILEISDTGIGIDPNDQPHIFNYFYRADPARPTYLGGVGLGLSIVKMIIEAHNGKIEVDSVPGKGSTFTLSLPVAAGARVR